MLTAKGEEVDRVLGFELGADDYVVKPFSVESYVANLFNLKERIKKNFPSKEQISIGDVELI
ncbi:MAG: hypothetical protein CM15mP86_05540 [Gammaproteobacteria bacterium]|nr:MAG: hypothetical protein CM15mP86_05540 [Gammaproteobacteria bacterium]